MVQTEFRIPSRLFVFIEITRRVRVIVSLCCVSMTMANAEQVGGLVGLSGALGLWSASVLAAETEKPSEGISIDELKWFFIAAWCWFDGFGVTSMEVPGELKLKLSLYTAPPQNLHYVEPVKGQVEEGVSTLRKLAEPYTSWGQNIYGAVKPKVDSAVQFGQDSYTYLRNPPAEFYPRAGVIGFAGILGLFLARGSRLKKLIYPTGLMTVGASMYYPQEAATVAKNTGDAVYDWALQAYVAAEKLMKAKPAPAEKGAEVQMGSALSCPLVTFHLFPAGGEGQGEAVRWRKRSLGIASTWVPMVMAKCCYL
ncbi:hypothetical protein NFI96_023772 [Prochilodus magdalenae]|nr:hypothetical protein NFI96_023772 [Prochilodus magdalenae]